MAVASFTLRGVLRLGRPADTSQSGRSHAPIKSRRSVRLTRCRHYCSKPTRQVADAKGARHQVNRNQPPHHGPVTQTRRNPATHTDTETQTPLTQRVLGNFASARRKRVSQLKAARNASSAA